MTTTTLPRVTSMECQLGTVADAMTGEVLSFDVGTPGDLAVHRLEQTGVSGAPVLDHGRVVGVVTLRDLLARAVPDGSQARTSGPFLRYEHLLARHTVRELMTTEPVTARSDWPLARAVLAMEEAAVNRIPVITPDGQPAGILTRDDVLGALARVLRREQRAAATSRRPLSRMAPD